MQAVSLPPSSMPVPDSPVRASSNIRVHNEMQQSEAQEPQQEPQSTRWPRLAFSTETMRRFVGGFGGTSSRRASLPPDRQSVQSARHRCRHRQQRRPSVSANDHGVCPECLEDHPFSPSRVASVPASPIAAILARGTASDEQRPWHGQVTPSDHHAETTADSTSQMPDGDDVQVSDSQWRARHQQYQHLKDAPWAELTGREKFGVVLVKSVSGLWSLLELAFLWVLRLVIVALLFVFVGTVAFAFGMTVGSLMWDLIKALMSIGRK